MRWEEYLEHAREKVLVGKAEQMRQLRRYNRRREDKLQVKSMKQKRRAEPGLIYLIPRNSSRSSVNTVTNLLAHYPSDYWLLKKE
jgi:chemotaxis response regulator CheB